MSAVITVRAGNRTLADGSQVLRDIEFAAHAGEHIAITGPSGSGKSTLLSCIGLTSPFDPGSRFEFDGVPIGELGHAEITRIRGRRIGFVPQNSWLIDHLTVRENVQLPLMHRRDIARGLARPRTTSLLEQLGIGALAGRKPGALSGGERQRVAIARALVTEPALVLADEPTGALNQDTGDTVLGLLLRLVRDARACLITVTHDPRIARDADREFRVDRGRLSEVPA